MNSRIVQRGPISAWAISVSRAFAKRSMLFNVHRPPPIEIEQLQTYTLDNNHGIE